MDNNIYIEQQKLFFEFVKKHHQKKKNFTNTLMDILDLSVTSVYKKMRGESLLTLKELVEIKNHYHISIDQFFYDKYSPTNFQFDALISSPTSPLDFLKNVSKNLYLLTRARQVSYVYICNEVPLYHVLQFPLLSRFKMYVWNELSWRIKGTTEQEFTKEMYANIPEWDEVVENMLEIYFDSPGIEIWNTLFFDATIEQIKYLFKTGDIPSFELAIEILNEVRSLKELLLDFTKKGIKYIKKKPEKSSAKGEFYFTSLYSGSELVHLKSDNMSTIVTGFDSPNMMRTHDPRMTEYSKNHIDNIIRYSINITKSNKIQRNLFFVDLDKKLDATEQELIQYSKMRGI